MKATLIFPGIYELGFNSFGKFEDSSCAWIHHGLCSVSAGNVRLHSPCEIWYSDSAQTARKLVENCRGCSNSWAADWSFRAWFPPFLKLRITLTPKDMFHKLKNKT